MTSRNWDFYIHLLSWALVVIGICTFVSVFIALFITDLTAAAVSNPMSADFFLAQIAFLGKLSLTIGVVEGAILLGIAVMCMGAKFQ